MGLHPYDKACMTEAGLPTDPPETLIKNLTSDNWRVQRPACVRLCEMSREELLPHFDSIFALLDHELWEVTHSAQTIFYEVFNADDLHPHLPKFLSLLEDLRKNAVRHSVLEMLDHKIDKGVLAGHVHLLFGSLEHKEWLVRWAALKALALLEEDVLAKQAPTILKHISGNPHPHPEAERALREATVQVLERLPEDALLTLQATV